MYLFIIVDLLKRRSNDYFINLQLDIKNVVRGTGSVAMDNT